MTVNSAAIITFPNLARGTLPLIFFDIGRDCILEKVIPSVF